MLFIYYSYWQAKRKIESEIKITITFTLEELMVKFQVHLSRVLLIYQITINWLN